MSISELLFLVVIFIANTFEAMTGFAGTLLAMPASMMLLGLYEAKAILNIIAVTMCVVIAFSNYTYINWRELGKILIFMLIGMVAGMIVFEKLSADFLLNVYAIIVMVIAGRNLFVNTKVKSKASFYHLLIVVIAGIIHGMFLSGSALLVVYALITLRDKYEFRATIAAVWVVLDSIMLVNQIRLGYVDRDIITLTLYSILPLVGAVLLGNFLHQYIKQRTFFIITYILVFVSGVSLIVY